MIRSPMNTAVAALLIFGATTARAETLHMDMTSYNTLYTGIFGGLSFDLNTAETADTIITGNITPGSSSVYTGFAATGGVSNGSLVWNGVDYRLQSASFGYYFDGEGYSNGVPDSNGPFNLDIILNFTNGMTFVDENQVSVDALSVARYNPSQFLAAATLKAYNGDVTAGFIEDNGANTGITGFVAKTTPVPEPGTLALFAVGLAGIAMSRRRIES